MSLKNLKYDKRELSREELGLINEEAIAKMDGIYVFVIEGCWNCHQYFEQLNLQGVDYSNWNIVQVLGNITFFLNELKLDDMPTTRIYKNGSVVFEIFGVLFPNNITMLMEKYNG